MTEDDQNKAEALERLLEEIRSGDNERALKAVEELREKEWLMDGSLWKAKLRRVDLTGAKLWEADLRDVDLWEAKLWEVDLRTADLRGVDMWGADLSEARLDGADLRGADLRGAKLGGTILTRADLRGTDLTDAKLGGTVLTGVDLSEVIGLEYVRHYRSSHISMDTLIKSKGKIPEKFLRGCGVPDLLIQYLPGIVGDAIQYYSVFISYSHEENDKQFAKQLFDKLQAEGIRCWLDEHSLKPGDKFWNEIGEAIKQRDKIILCCSEHSLGSWWVNDELEKTLEEERTLLKNTGRELLKLIPITLDDAVFDKSRFNAGPLTQIRNRHIEDFRNWKDFDAFEQGFQRILKALRTDDWEPKHPEPKLGRERD